jgi:hypothetical protein
VLVKPPLLVGFVFTFHEHLGSPSIIGGVRVYPSRAPGFSLHYWWGSCLPFTSTWVLPPLLVGFVFTLHEHLGSPSIIGGVRVYHTNTTNNGWRTQVLVKGKHETHQ